ncbi:MAG: IS256 family transposase [Culicoidibacterales bacterium]
MNNFTTDIMHALVQKDDITEVFRKHLEMAVNQLMKIELTEHLDYEKHDRIGFNSGNSRNGYYERSVKTEYGELALKIPRDRNGEFQQQTITPYKRNTDTLEDFVIHMYQKGLTMSDIADTLEKMYGHHYSPQTISNMTKIVTENVIAFHERKLAKRYVCVYLDATYIALKRETVAKEAVYIAIGIREDGAKEIISYCIAPTESASVWKELFVSIKERGVEEVLLFIADGLTGLANQISEVYPESKFQTCCVHVSRNIASKVRISDRNEVCEDFKKVYTNTSKCSAQIAIDTFIHKWEKKYPRVTANLAANSHLITFYDFPESIWRSIYSTNLIEGFNKQLKRFTKRKEQFPNENSLDRFLVSQFEAYNFKFSTTCHRGFKDAQDSLLDMFKH